MKTQCGNTTSLINKYLEMIRIIIPELIHLLEDEDSPILFCYSMSLSENEQISPTVEYLANHLLLKTKSNGRDSNVYISANSKLQITVFPSYIQYTLLNDHSIGKVKIIDRTVVYGNHYDSVDVLFLENAFQSKFDHLVTKPHSVGVALIEQIENNLPIQLQLENHTAQASKIILEQAIQQHLNHIPPEEHSAIISEFLGQIDVVLDKFLNEFRKFFHVEEIATNPRGFEYHSLDWARERLPAIQQQTLLSIISCATNYSEITPSCFTYLFQPLEDYIFGKGVHTVLMEALRAQYKGVEEQFQHIRTKMQEDPSIQPEGITESLRKLSLDEAAQQLNNLDSPQITSPIQKLICLKEAFSSLESLLAGIEPTPSSHFPHTEPIRSSFDDINSSLLRHEFSSDDLFRDLRRCGSPTNSEMLARDRRRDVMHLLTLLLIYHAPVNLKSHLDLILFHTINDEMFGELSMYHTVFLASLDRILGSPSRPAPVKPTPIRPISMNLSRLTVQSEPLIARHSYSFGLHSPVNLEPSPPPPTTLVVEQITKPRTKKKKTYQTFYWGLLNDNSRECLPVFVEDLNSHRPISIQCGDKHVLLLTKNQQLLTYGSGGEGQLGHGFQRDSDTFMEVELLSSQDVISMSAGGSHSAVVTRDGKLFCFGGNMWGQIGMEITCESVPIPTQVTFSDVPKRVLKVSCGSAHNLVLLQDGTVWSWGLGANGRLGHGSEYNFPSPKQILEFPPDVKLVDICCGGSFSICVSSKDELFLFGKGSDGEIGTGELRDVLEPVKLDFDFGKIHMISAFNHSLVLGSKGLFSWGWGEHGQLGLGDTSSQSRPCEVDTSPHVISVVSCGAFHSAAVSKEGVLLTWGGNSHGQLGHGDTATQTSPYEVDFLRDQSVVDVSCGFGFTIAVLVATEDE